MKLGERCKIWHPEKSVLCEFSCGDDCVIHAPVWIGDGVHIGNRVKIQAFTFIPTGVFIRDDCFIGPHVCFTNDKYPPSHGKEWQHTIVEENVTIGAGAVILPGVRIGNHATIGAGTVVLHDVPPRETVVGNPARSICVKS